MRWTTAHADKGDVVRHVLTLAIGLAFAFPAMADDRPSMTTAPAAVPEAAKDVGGAGRWRLRHTDGSTFVITLADDGSATSDFGSGETGAWRREGGRLHAFWTDGWDDVIYLAPDGSWRKAAWGPETPRGGPPLNDAPAERLE